MVRVGRDLKDHLVLQKCELCLGFQGPMRQSVLSLCLSFPHETLTVINHFETHHLKKKSSMKYVAGNNADFFCLFVLTHDSNSQRLELELNSAQTEKKFYYHYSHELYLHRIILCTIGGRRAEHQVLCGSLGCLPTQPDTVVAQLRDAQGARGQQRH